MPSNFLQVLPDPNYKITDAGFEDAAGAAGQGFVNIAVREITSNEYQRNINGKAIKRMDFYPWFEIDVKYNPLTQLEFAPIYNFLMQKRGSLKSFYISLPQYSNPKSSTFVTWLGSNTITVQNDASAGASYINVGSWAGNSYSGLPSFGDIFNISDPEDSLHTKAYQVTRVETYTDYLTGNQPATTTIRIHFSPGLQKFTNSGAEVVFLNPLIKVKQIGDVQEYELGDNNLYSFSLKLLETYH